MIAGIQAQRLAALNAWLMFTRTDTSKSGEARLR
jgi:hypothetical protein